MDKSPAPKSTVKLPVCRTAFISAFFTGISFLCILLIFLSFEIHIENLEKWFTVYFSWISISSFALATCFGLIALFISARTIPPLRGKTLGYFSLTVSTLSGLFFFSLPYQGQVKPIAQRAVCRTNLMSITNTLFLYAYEQNNKFPEYWCDMLIQYYDHSPRSFICPASENAEGESSYALNKHIINYKLDELPGDIVLLFEVQCRCSENEKMPIKNREIQPPFSTVKELFADWNESVCLDCWNQIAGPESLDLSHHYYQGCNIVFTDGHSEWISYDNLHHLKWNPEDPALRWIPEELPEGVIVRKKYARFTLITVTASFCVWLIATLFSYQKKKHLFVLLSIALSSIIGFCFSFFFEQGIFLPIDTPRGLVIGLFSGAFAGFLYAIWLLRELKVNKKRLRFDLLIGIFFGIACGLIVDGALMYYYGFDPFSIGIGFYGGIIIGAGNAKLLSNLFKKLVIGPLELSALPSL